MLRTTSTRTAWLVVGLLMPVALLNYLDRQMLATMQSSVMSDIPSIGSEENWGVMLGQFKWVYAFLSPSAAMSQIDSADASPSAEASSSGRR